MKKIILITQITPTKYKINKIKYLSNSYSSNIRPFLLIFGGKYCYMTGIKDGAY